MFIVSQTMEEHIIPNTTCCISLVCASIDLFLLFCCGTNCISLDGNVRMETVGTVVKTMTNKVKQTQEAKNQSHYTNIYMVQQFIYIHRTAKDIIVLRNHKIHFGLKLYYSKPF